jgi:PD-(D/E)XK nuclease superfamily
MTTWSLSRLKTYEQCPAKYKYQHIDRLAMPKHPAAERGIAIHKDLEMFLTGAAPSLPANLSMYHGWLENLKPKKVFTEHRVGLRADWTPTEFDAPDVWLRSVLDLKVLGDDNTAHVYDWKTGKIYPDHVDQKTLYSATTFAEHPDLYQVTAIHVYVDLGKNTQQIFHRDQATALRQGWDSRVKPLLAETNWIPNPSYSCRWCPYSRAQGGPCRF